MQLSKEQKRKISRELDLELGIQPPKSKIYKNKKLYNRKTKHKKD